MFKCLELIKETNRKQVKKIAIIQIKNNGHDE
jgi:hypothetical protein